MSRYFKLIPDQILAENSLPIDVSKISSEPFKGKNSMDAAKKAFVNICHSRIPYQEDWRTRIMGLFWVSLPRVDDSTYTFSLQEMTTEEGIFTYRGVRKEMRHPGVIEYGDRKLTIRYTSTIRKI